MIEPKVIARLKEAIREEHKCEALYINTVHVTKPLEGDRKWDGLVKVFELIGHPRARRCYAWTFREGGMLRTMTALESPPVTSPEIAVSLTTQHPSPIIGDNKARATDERSANLETG